jgi:non-specific serine/threonine protein kinase
MAHSDTEQTPVYRYKFGIAEFDEGAMELRIDNEAIKLEPKPLELLQVFCQNSDIVLTKHELLEIVWHGKSTVENVLANAISKLRTALGPDLNDRISTVNRIGYKFSGPIEKIAIGRQFNSGLKLKSGDRVSGTNHYILVDQLSSSNGRQVWLAEHRKSKERRVFKLVDDAKNLTGLKREVTINRILNQSADITENITKLYDWNFENAPFYAEYEYGGLDLQQWSNANLSEISFAQRLNLAIEIVSIISKAHDNGIIHKDIKPQNILISDNVLDEDKPKIRLIDFGSGRLDTKQTDLGGITLLGLSLEEVMGEEYGVTLQYMAPELHEGKEANVKSDVYALGVIIYQLIIGDIQKLFTANWQQDVSDPLLRQDIMLATTSNLSERVQTSAELLKRLQSLKQRKETLETDARKDVENNRLRKIKERERIRRPWILAAFSVLTIGLATSIYLGFQADKARSIAVQQAELAKSANEFLQEVISAADPRTPGVTPDASISSALSRAQLLIEERYIGEFEATEQLLLTIARSFNGISEYEQHASTLGKVRELRSKHYGPRHPLTILAQFQEVQGYNRAGKLELAGMLLESANSSLADLEEPESRLLLASNLANGQYYLIKFEFEKSASYYEKAQDLYYDSKVNDLNLLLETRLNLAQCYSRLNKTAEAVSLLATLTKEPFLSSPQIAEWRLLRARQQYGLALIFDGQFDLAEPIIQSSLDDFLRIYGEQSNLVGETYGHLAKIYGARSEWETALKALIKEREITCNIQGEKHIACLGVLSNEGRARLLLGDYSQAVENFSLVKAGFVELLGEQSPPVMWIDFQLATAWLELGEYDKVGGVLPLLDTQVLNQASPGEPWEIMISLTKGRYLKLTGEVEKGNTILREAIRKMPDAGFDEKEIIRQKKFLS